MTMLQRTLERSHQDLRPERIEFDLSGDFLLPTDAGAIVWTTATHDLTNFRQARKFCDDQGRLSLVTDGDLTLPDGRWRIVMDVMITKTGVATGDAAVLAICASAGAVPLLVSEPIVFPDQDPCTLPVRLEATISSDLLGAGTNLVIDFRAVQNVGTGTLTIDAAYVGYCERIGNLGQEDRK